MKGPMQVHYDEEGDFLEISLGDASNCYFDNLGGGVFKITDKKTSKVKGIVIHNFKKRTKNLDEIKLSLPFLASIPDVALWGIGLIIMVVGVFTLRKSKGGGKQAAEVPIYHGKNIVGYRRMGNPGSRIFFIHKKITMRMF